MIDIKINEKTYELPTSWSDISLKLFNDIVKIELDKNKNIEESELIQSVATMAMLIGCDVVDVMGFHKKDFVTLTKELMWSSTQPKADSKVISDIIINGVTYIMPVNIDEMTIGESISMESIIKEDPNDLAGLISLLLRPRIEVFNKATGETEYKQEPFDTKTYGARRELFLDNINIEDALTITGFFSNGVTGYSKSSKDISDQEPAGLKKMEKAFKDEKQ